MFVNAERKLKKLLCQYPLRSWNRTDEQGNRITQTGFVSIPLKELE